MKKTKGVLIYWLVFILVLMMSLFSIFTSSKGTMLSTESVNMTNLYLCGVSHNSPENSHIKICGHLMSDKEPVPLRIFIYRMPEKELVAENPVDDIFIKGDFSREFILVDGKEERYKVIVYLYREIIDEVEFSIQK